MLSRKLNQMKNIVFAFAIMLFVACTKTSQAPKKAEIWLPGKVSSELPEFATTINSEGTHVYFNRTSPDRSSMQLMKAKFAKGEWNEPVPLPFSTGQYLDVDPFLTHDGNRLYFSSTRPIEEGGEAGNWDTWYVERNTKGWSGPINPGAPLNSDSTEIFVTLTLSGNAYFVTERDGDRGIVVSRLEKGTYQPVEKVRPTLRGEAIYASNPAIASDESFLIVALRDPEGNQTPDLFVSWNENGSWSEFQNLGENVNAPLYADFAPGLSKDDKILFFSSERPGIVGEQEEGVRPPGDIYWVDLAAVFAELKQ